MNKRGEHNCLGFAVQLTSLRYSGRFLEDCAEAPFNVVNVLARRLGILDVSCLSLYNDQRQRHRHIEEICQLYGYCEFTDPIIGFRFTSWVYTHCWTGTDRPLVLFGYLTGRLHGCYPIRYLLPGASVVLRAYASGVCKKDIYFTRCLFCFLRF